MNISIIGCGNVGEAIGFLIVNKCEQFTLNIMEPNKRKKGKWLELMHITGLSGNGQVVYNDQKLLENADWIFYTAGAGIKIGQDRREVIKENVELAKKIFKPIKFKSTPYIIVLTNPVDAITYFIRFFTGFNRNKVLGTGTSIDAARFSFNLFRSDIYFPVAENGEKYPSKQWVLGEHGKTMVPLFSQLGFDITPSQKKEMYDLTLNAALEVKQYQDATYTCVASCAFQLMEMIHDQSDGFLCFNTALDSDLMELLNVVTPIDFSWAYCPKNLNKKDIQPNEKEWQMLRTSAKELEELIKSVNI